LKTGPAQRRVRRLDLSQNGISLGRLEVCGEAHRHQAGRARLDYIGPDDVRQIALSRPQTLGGAHALGDRLGECGPYPEYLDAGRATLGVVLCHPQTLSLERSYAALLGLECARSGQHGEVATRYVGYEIAFGFGCHSRGGSRCGARTARPRAPLATVEQRYLGADVALDQGALEIGGCAEVETMKRSHYHRFLKPNERRLAAYLW
jgi:hypothetical protein